MRRTAASPRAIGFAEVPHFHVAVARRQNPSLENQSVLVGGDPTKRGKLVASSADLQTLGILPGIALAEAADRAPEAVWVPTDMAAARAVSGTLRAAVRRVVEAVEVEGLGGFYMKASSDALEATEWAQTLSTSVAEETGLALRVGVAPVRFVARLAAEDAGDAGAQVVAPSELDRYLERQPLERFPGVGPKTAARLAELGASDVPSLRAIGLERLEVLLGNHGRSLWMLAGGDDPRPLRVKRHPSTLSRERSLTRDDGEGEWPWPHVINSLAASLNDALEREGLVASRIALRLTLADGRTLTRSRTEPEGIASAQHLRATADALLREASSTDDLPRKLGLVLAGLDVRGAEERQLGLF